MLDPACEGGSVETVMIKGMDIIGKLCIWVKKYDDREILR